MASTHQEFMQFSDQIRLQTANLSSLSIGDSIWSGPLPSSGGDLNSGATAWKAPSFSLPTTQKLAFGNTNFNRFNNNDTHSSSNAKSTLGTFKGGAAGGGNYNGEVKNYFGKATMKPIAGGDGRRRGNNSVEGKGSGGRKKNGGNNGNDNGGAVDKRFKTLPAAEALPRSEAVGGYIFVCNNDTMQENLQRQLFGLPPRYRDSVRAITPGLPLFLYNYTTHQLHGIFEAASFGGTNIDPAAWEDKKCPGESRFPAQVRVMTRKICGPLEEDSFRPILHHYDGPKFRLELSVPEALALLDIFAENSA